MANNGKSTVLSFEQPSEFFGKRAQRLLDQSDLWGALANLRRALRKDGENAGYILDTAEILAQMGLYERSCRLLFSLILKGDRENTPECYFALGCNFYALRMSEISRECLLTYLQMDETGEYREDCNDMLYMLEEELRDAEQYLYTAAEQNADEGKYALDNGDYAKAQQLLQKALQQDPSMQYARNNLALAYYCAGDTKAAIREGEKVLQRKPDDAHGLCNMALFLNTRGQYDQAVEFVRRAVPSEEDDGEEQYKICLTMAELGMDEDVFQQTGDLLKYSPYDERALFLHAVAGCNLNMPSAVYRDVNRLMLLDPESEMFGYLHDLVAERMQDEKEQKHHPISYTAPVPYRQMIKKVMRAQELMRKNDEEQAKTAWDEDATLRGDLLWCLYYSEGNMLRLTLCQFLADLKHPPVTTALKEMLVSLQLPDEAKKSVIVALSHAGEKPPYLAVIGGHLTEVNVREAQESALNRKAPPCYERVLKEAISWLMRRDDPDLMSLCAQIWLRHMAAQPEPMPYLKNEQSWAVALRLATLSVAQIPYELGDHVKEAHTFGYLLSRRVHELIERYQQQHADAYFTDEEEHP